MKLPQAWRELWNAISCIRDRAELLLGSFRCWAGLNEVVGIRSVNAISIGATHFFAIAAPGAIAISIGATHFFCHRCTRCYGYGLSPASRLPGWLVLTRPAKLPPSDANCAHESSVG